jgi:DNA repair exonuclease SbcCD ATPase subunit
VAADDAAVTVTLRADLKAYEAALKSAVRSTETAARAAEKAVSGIGKGGGASKVIEGNFKKSSQAIANDAKILQFQLNDIFSGLASGQGIRAVQVQLGQIAQQMTGASLAGGARLLGTALAGMINPLNLAIVAFGVLAGVAASYFTSSEEQAKAATDALKKQADELDNLAKKYGKLFPEIQRAADRQHELLDAAEKAIAVQTALTAAYEDTGKTLDTLGDQLLEIESLLDFGAAPEVLSAITKSFNDLKEAVKNHNASSKDAQAILTTLNGIIASTEGRVKELATTMRNDLVKSFAELDRAAKTAG